MAAKNSAERERQKWGHLEPESNYLHISHYTWQRWCITLPFFSGIKYWTWRKGCFSLVVVVWELRCLFRAKFLSRDASGIRYKKVSFLFAFNLIDCGITQDHQQQQQSQESRQQQQRQMLGSTIIIATYGVSGRYDVLPKPFVLTLRSFLTLYLLFDMELNVVYSVFLLGEKINWHTAFDI